MRLRNSADHCAGEACVRLPTQTVCGRLVVPVLSCASKTAECSADSNCALGHVCVAGSCVQGGNSCGRPFLVQGAERRALAQARADWSAPPCEPLQTALAPSARAILCEHFTQAALMEHASIAAFARFSLQLLALGAPAELVERAARALADETEHARSCFALAARYGGASVGPGALSIQGCLDGGEPVLIFATAFREACIGETLAAMEALESAEGAREPALRATLTRIAEDEAQHAELGWRFASWMLETSEPKLRAELLGVLAALTDSELEPRCAERPSEPLDAAALSEHGLLSPSARARLRETTLREVVAPCSASLLRAYDVLPARAHEKSASLTG